MPSPPPPQHIALLGAGIIGLSSAHYLLAHPSLPPHSTVTLIENSHLGVAAGASSQAGGFIAGGDGRGWTNERSRALAAVSFGCFRELAGELEGGRTYGWRECGATGLKVGEGEEKRSAYRNLPGGTKVEAGREEEEGRWMTGEREDMSGPGMGQIDPREFCQTLHAHLTKNPAFTTLFGEPLALATHSPTSHTLTVLPHHAATPTTLALTHVVITAGPWSAALCAKLRLPVPPISNLPGHSLILRPALAAVGRDSPLPVGAVFAGINGAEGGVPLPGETAHHLTATEIAQGFTASPEFFPRANGRVYLAGENHAPSSSPFASPHHPNGLPPTVDLVKTIIDRTLVARLISAGAQCSPALDVRKGAVIEAEQFCYRPITPDGDPVIDVLAPGVVVASGHGPWGICLGPGTGKVVAELVLEGAARSVDLAPLSLGRFPQKSKL